MRTTLVKLAARYTFSRRRKAEEDPIGCQENVWKRLLSDAKHTAFGTAHNFAAIRNYEDYKKQVPVRDYEAFRPYIDRIVADEKDVLWPGVPLAFCTTSGTTSGIKHIPITRSSIPYHVSTMLDAFFHYIETTGKAQFTRGKGLYLSASPVLSNKLGAIPCGRLSGAINNYMPSYIRRFTQAPLHAVNKIVDFDEKLDAVVAETCTQDIRFIAGNPLWMKQFFHKLLAYTGKDHVGEVFPNFSLVVSGGTSLTPYEPHFSKLIGYPVDTIDIYPSSEGFIAYQDRVDEPALRLAVHTDLFYEFIPVEKLAENSPPRLQLSEVDTKTNYALVLSSSAGLWSYLIGDTVRFVDTKPYRLLVTGRVQHYISVFGEHVIAEEIERTLAAALRTYPETVIHAFTVAARVAATAGESCYEWWIEFLHLPHNIAAFTLYLDETLQGLNPYYKDARVGKTIAAAQVIPVEKNSFIAYLKKQGRYDSQSKVPHLSNDRKIVQALKPCQVYAEL